MHTAIRSIFGHKWRIFLLPIVDNQATVVVGSQEQIFRPR